MTIICMELPSLAQQINSDQERIKLHPLVIPTKYCFLIVGEDTRFIFFLYFSFSFYVFMSILVIYKVYLLSYLFLAGAPVSCYYFFKILKIFSCSGMFRNVPACSRMFGVPGFIDGPVNNADITKFCLCYSPFSDKLR